MTKPIYFCFSTIFIKISSYKYTICIHNNVSNRLYLCVMRLMTNIENCECFELQLKKNNLFKLLYVQLLYCTVHARYVTSDFSSGFERRISTEMGIFNVICDYFYQPKKLLQRRGKVMPQISKFVTSPSS